MNFFLTYKLDRAVIIFFISIFFGFSLLLGLRYFDFIDRSFFLYRWLDVNSENNISTYFNGLLFFIVAFRSFKLILLKGDKILNKVGWSIIGIVFIFLGFDEVLQIHESQPSSWGLTAHNWFKYYLIGLVITSFPCLFLFLSLPKGIKILFITSACIFLFGAVALESIANHFALSQMWRTYVILTLLEEFFEMLGLLTFSATLERARYLKEKFY